MSAVAETRRERRRKQRKENPTLLDDFVTLSKPGITWMCVIMAAGGMALAVGNTESEWPSAWLWLWTLVGTALSVASANTLNMILEREGDRLMNRTRNRPLPAGRMKVQTAIGFSSLTGAASIWLLYTQTTPLAAWLSLFALLSYVLVYTPLKRKTPAALIIGSIPGAIPPLLGWTAVTGRIDPAGVVLFLILMIWQLPHFLAISIYRGRDYAAAGIKTVSEVHGEERAKIQSLLYSLVLFPVSLLLVPLGVAGSIYFIVATGLGVWFFVFSVRGFEPKAGNKWARQFFFASLVYLPALTAALAVDALIP